MFNDDPYSRQRQQRPVKTQGALPQLLPVPPAGAPKLTRAAPQAASSLATPPATDVSPKLRREASMFAPVTNHFSPDAAVGKLVDHRLAKSGQPMPSTIGPPAPAKPGVLTRLAPNSTATALAAQAPVAGETTAGEFGRRLRGKLATVAAPFEAAGSLLAGGVSAGAEGVANFGRGLTGQAPVAAAPAVTPAPAAQSAAPSLAVPPAPKITRLPAQAAATPTRGNPGGQPNAAAPGQIGVSQQTQQPLPGAPVVGADGSVVYDQAFMDRNKGMIDQYAKTNVVQSVVPPPGVAQSSVGGGTPTVGGLARAPVGFTREDRLQQLDNFDRQGAAYKQRTLSEKAQQQAFFGNADRAASLERAAATAGLQQAPRVEPFKRQDPNDAARLAIEAEQSRVQNEQTQVQTQGQQLALQQAQQVQALTQQLLTGDEAQRKQAADSLAALQGTNKGEPIKVKRQIDTGQKDVTGAPILADQEVLYDPRTGQWIQPPAQGAQGGPPAAAIDYLRQNDTPETRAAFKAKYGVDPANLLG